MNKLLSTNFTYPKNVKFTCQKCAACCGDTQLHDRTILLTDSEADLISQKTSLEANIFSQKIEGLTPYTRLMKKTDKGQCTFLREAQCSIYVIRPLICRFYPFQLAKNKNNKAQFTYTQDCIGVGTGSLRRRPFFSNLFEDFLNTLKESVEDCR